MQLLRERQLGLLQPQIRDDSDLVGTITRYIDTGIWGVDHRVTLFVTGYDFHLDALWHVPDKSERLAMGASCSTCFSGGGLLSDSALQACNVRAIDSTVSPDQSSGGLIAARILPWSLVAEMGPREAAAILPCIIFVGHGTVELGSSAELSVGISEFLRENTVSASKASMQRTGKRTFLHLADIVSQSPRGPAKIVLHITEGIIGHDASWATAVGQQPGEEDPSTAQGCAWTMCQVLKAHPAAQEAVVKAACCFWGSGGLAVECGVLGTTEIHIPAMAEEPDGEMTELLAAVITMSHNDES